MTKQKLDKNEKEVLLALVEDSDLYYPFVTIMDIARLTRKEVRYACRSLTNKGLAQYAKGLVKLDDIGVAGSGYGITEKGIDFLNDKSL